MYCSNAVTHRFFLFLKERKKVLLTRGKKEGTFFLRVAKSCNPRDFVGILTILSLFALKENAKTDLSIFHCGWFMDLPIRVEGIGHRRRLYLYLKFRRLSFAQYYEYLE